TQSPASSAAASPTPAVADAQGAGDEAAAVDQAAASAEATARLLAELRESGQLGSAPAIAEATAATAPQPGGSAPIPAATQVARPAPEATTPAATASAQASTPPAPVARAATGGRPLVIAIDAGHGGQDPGAIGPSGTREKDVTLAIARELARQVNATPGLRAHLVRDRDVFIPLNNRARIARQAGADMFISIHADAAENRNAKGSSVYVLSLRGASSQRARWLAEKENAADLIGGVRAPSNDSVLTSVLLDLTQSGQMKASEDAGNHILAGLKRIGNNHKPHI